MGTVECEMDIDEKKATVKKTKTDGITENGEAKFEVANNSDKDCNGATENNDEVAMETCDNSVPNGDVHLEADKKSSIQENEGGKLDSQLDKDDCEIKSSEEGEDKEKDAIVKQEKDIDEDCGQSLENSEGKEDKDTIVKQKEEIEDCAQDTEMFHDVKIEQIESSSGKDHEDLGENSKDISEVNEIKSEKDNVNLKPDKDNVDSKSEKDNDVDSKSEKDNDVDLTSEKDNDVDLKSEKNDDGDNSDGVEVIEDDDPVETGQGESSLMNKVSSKSGNISKTSIKIIQDDSMNNDDIEIVGESKAVTINGGTISKSNNVLIIPQNVSSGIGSFPVLSKGFSTSTLLAKNLQQSGHRLPNILGGNITSLSSNFVISGATTSSNTLVTAQTAAPPKPKSSLDQIELIRWEIANRINTRPKYFKPNPSSELGPLSKFLFDMGSDMIKESVYHELVKIQSKKNDEEKLTDKEKNDLEKLKEIEKDLFATIGHLKMKMKKRCKTCQFQTESINVMHLHKQYPHEDEKMLNCSHCKFTTKQPSAYKFHAEAEHGLQPRVYERKAFYECNMCPYENNQEQKIVIHKQRCLKQFRPHFNLHPSCLSGAEINLCLENIFYKPIIPKGLKILQQKHAQQQQALAEARRQQAQVQALAAQKNKGPVKNQSLVRMPQAIAPRQSQKMPTMPRIPIQIRAPLQNKVKLPEKGKSGRPTVANMLNNRQNIPAKGPPPPTPSGKAHGGFEVCEICGGYVKDRKALRIHFFYAHRIDLPFNLFERQLAPLYCATCYVRFWTAQGLRKHIDTHKEENATTGVVGKCISCGHHVLNLLIHMRIVHNREIQHYINALMCMFCGMHFGSRNDVDGHIKKVHGIIDPVTGAIKTALKTPQKNAKKSGGQPLKGSVCVLCNLNFGRNVDLTRHCMRMHHTCMKCGMVVIDKASLIKHTCLSSPSGTRDCSMCKETGFHPAYFVKHLRDKHLKKFKIQVARLSKETIENWTKRPYNQDDKVLVEISDSSDDEGVVKKSGPPKQIEPSKKRQRMGPASFMKKCESQKMDSEVVQIDDEDESTKKTKNGNDEKDTDIKVEEKQVTSQNDSDIENTDADGKKHSDNVDNLPDNEEKDLDSVGKEGEKCDENEGKENSDEELKAPAPGEKRKIGPLSFQKSKRKKSS